MIYEHHHIIYDFNLKITVKNFTLPGLVYTCRFWSKTLKHRIFQLWFAVCVGFLWLTTHPTRVRALYYSPSISHRYLQHGGTTTWRFRTVYIGLHQEFLVGQVKMCRVVVHASRWHLWCCCWIVWDLQLCFQTEFPRFRCLDRLCQRLNRHDYPSAWLMGKACVDFPPSCIVYGPLWVSSCGFFDRIISCSFVR